MLNKISNYFYWKSLNLNMWRLDILKKIRINKKKRILSISKMYTKEEFLNKTMKEKSYMFDGTNCPTSHGLKVKKCNTVNISEVNCSECWKLAVKNIKFKGGL